jgi:adenine-specific DNA-methyltransferase
LSIPHPLFKELPSEYANRLGQWYWSWNKPHKTLGQYFTPLSVARFMAKMVEPRQGALRILDAGAGMGILSCALCEVLNSDIELEAYEVDNELADYLDACLAYTKVWMQSKNLRLSYRVIRDDFVLTHADALNGAAKQLFDIAISNPPYFKLSKLDSRARAAERVVYGQPNIYALFMAVSAALLRPGGQAVYITPRSYAAGEYFKRFREYFFSQVRPRAFHVFESRRDVFDAVLQENVILLAERSSDNREVVVSSSNSSDFSNFTRYTQPMDKIINQDGVLHLPLSEHDHVITEIVRSWSGRLHLYGLKISTGPVVPFRALNLVSTRGDVPATHAPLLWMQNVRPMHYEWPVDHKGQYLLLQGAEKLLLPNANYVLLRRFSAKEERQRLTAAPYLADIDTAVIGVENHLNYIHRPGGQLSEDEARGMSILLNSRLMNTYFRMFSGNTQVSATELRNLPLPSLDMIEQMGRVATSSNAEALITEMLYA